MSTARLAGKSNELPGSRAMAREWTVDGASRPALFRAILLGNKRQNPRATQDSAAIPRKSWLQPEKVLIIFERCGLDFRASGGYRWTISPSMIQQVAQKRRKRLLQLREAQRRRRTRLKEEHKAFLQIILTEDMQAALRKLSALRDIPMHLCAAELIEEGLGRHSLEPVPTLDISNGPESIPRPKPDLIEPTL